jgi:hypothetical protein
MDKIILIAFIIPALITFPFLLQNADAFKLTNYEIKIEVEFFNHNQTNTNSLVSAIDNGLMEQIIFDIMEPVAVGQWSLDDIIADNSISSSAFPKFHNVVLLNGSSATIVTNTKLVVDPVIIEINTPQGVNKATVQDQIVNNTQSELRTMLQTHDIFSYIWKLQYDQGVLEVAETP